MNKLSWAFMIIVLTISRGVDCFAPCIGRHIKCVRRQPQLQTTNDDLTWTSVKDIIIKGVQLGSNADGLRGVFATAKVGGDLVKSDPLVTVPGNLVFEVTNTRPPTPFPKFVSQKLWEDSMWDQRLAFKLLHELKIVGLVNSEKSFWLPQLPASYSTPLHWDAQILVAECQYPALVDKVEKQRSEWRSFYDRWMADKNDAPDALRVSYDEYLRALECVNSRAFSGAYEGSNAGERQALLLFTGALTVAFPLLQFSTWEQSLSAAVAVGLSILAKDVFFSRASGLKRYVVCPFVDMFNHKSTASSDVSYNYFTNVFELRTESYAQGEQVFISYGKQSNDRLLQYYGFVDQDNPYDAYDFGLTVLEVLLKYGDELPAIPTVPSPQERLKTIAAALRITEVDDATVRGSQKGTPLRGDDVPVRFFRIAPSGAGTGSPPMNVAEILRAAEIRRGQGDEGTIARFDSVTTRAIRALYASGAEWAEITGGSNKIGNLEKLGAPLSGATEAAVASVLRCLARLELASKPTSMEDDIKTLSSLRASGSSGQTSTSGSGKKGFSSQTTSTAGSDVTATNPSGRYQNAVFAAINFRIEKKKLLAEAASEN